MSAQIAQAQEMNRRMARGQHPFLRNVLRQLFMPVLHRHGREAPNLRRVDVRVMDFERDAVRATAHFEDGSDYNYVVSEGAIRAQDVWLDLTEFACDVRANAHLIWSEEFENHLLREAEQAARTVVREAYARGDPRAVEIDYEAHRSIDRMRRFHFGEGEVAPTFMWAAPVTRPEQAVTITTVPVWRDIADQFYLETATEVRARNVDAERQQRTLAQMMRETIDRLFSANWLGRGPWDDAAFIDGWNLYEVGNPEAQAKGMALLKENLTPEQRAQYEQHKYFDVIGGTTGRTYRIHHGRQMNIRRLNRSGKPVEGLCFLPQGGLVAGDVMLAQKTALEVCENDALKVANKFPA